MCEQPALSQRSRSKLRTVKPTARATKCPKARRLWVAASAQAISRFNLVQPGSTWFNLVQPEVFPVIQHRSRMSLPWQVASQKRSQFHHFLKGCPLKKDVTLGHLMEPEVLEKSHQQLVGGLEHQFYFPIHWE